MRRPRERRPIRRRSPTATVTTTSGSRILVITSSSFRRLLREMPSIQQKVLEALAARIPDDLQ